jgi:hypothetical protein
MAEVFHELHGDYVENAGQQINLREYLDYYEPLGSALARLPDGTGGPFVHSFTDSGGRTVGSVGWVVSAKSKRFGGWKLWGMWTNQPMPAVALPLFWSVLEDPSRVSDWVKRANHDADRLLDSEEWDELLGGIKTARLREAPFREYLKAELSRAWAMPPAQRQPFELELTPGMLDLLPWLYLLGPFDPATASVKPNRFNTPGYQYILTEALPEGFDGAIPQAIDRMVDETAKSAKTGWRIANDLRARRNKPQTIRREPPPKASSSREKKDMPTHTPSRKAAPPEPPPLWTTARTLFESVWTPVFHLIVLMLLAWIAWNVYVIRKTVTVKPEITPATTSTEETTTTTTVAPVYEPDLSRARLRRIVTALRAQRTTRVNSAVLDEIARGGNDAADKLARVAVEVFLRRNGCYERTEAADGKFSTAEQRAIRNCSTLQDERLLKEGTTPDVPRALDWLEGIT